MQKKACFRILTVYLVFAVLVLTLPSPSWAMFVSSQPSSQTQTDLAAVQKTLESSVVKQRLMDYGLSSEEALARISRLSDEQIHQFASKLDSVQAGGDGVDALVFLVLVAIVVVVILEVSGHHIVFR